MSLKRLLDPMKRQFRLLISRAVVALTNDAGSFQTVQANALADETLDGMESFGLYGFHSRPKPGAEAVVACLGGVRSHGVVIATHDRRYRLKNLANGDVALADDQGQVVHLGRDGISIATSLPVTLQAASLAITADTTITGKLTVTDTATLQGDLQVKGNSTLGNGAVKQVKLSDDSPATTVKAK
jgi:phage baseplate assembly protein V